jgi:hypothetical protein
MRLQAGDDENPSVKAARLRHKGAGQGSGEVRPASPSLRERPTTRNPGTPWETLVKTVEDTRMKATSSSHRFLPML